MKRLLFSLYSFVLVSAAAAQSTEVFTKHLRATERITLRTRSVTNINWSMLDADSLNNNVLPTAKSVNDFVRSLVGTGGGGGGFNSTEVLNIVKQNTARPLNKFVVRGSAIMRPGTPVAGVIPWSLLTDADHQPVFFDSVATGGLRIFFPPVRKVHHMHVTVDETLAGQGIHVGPSVNLDNALLVITQWASASGYLIGNGTTWTRQGNIGSWTFTYNSTNGQTGVVAATPGQNFAVSTYKTVNYQYVGARNARLHLAFPDGQGAFWQIFQLRDNVTDTVITGPLTASDVIIVTSGFQTYGSPSPTINNTVFGNSANFWVSGEFEAWVVPTTVSTSSIAVDWQAYPSATSYKLLRSTSKNGVYTQVYSGTALSFTDSGLSANTTYFYRLVAVVAGADVNVSYTRAATAYN